MPSFTLNTTFNQTDLTMLYATGTNVVVAKPSSMTAAPNVAWVVFRPLPANGMSWEEQYGIYASTQNIQNGATLTQMAITPFPASSGQVYAMGPAGFFGPPQGGGIPNSYSAVNQYNNLPPNGQGYLTFGLYQNASVNGQSMNANAVSAAAVPYQSTAVMTPFTTIYIWTASAVTSNTVVTKVSSVQTEVTFGGSITEIDLQYDSSTGAFVNVGGSIDVDSKTGQLALAGGPKLPSGISLAYHLPTLG